MDHAPDSPIPPDLQPTVTIPPISANNSAAQIPTAIGQYRILRLLGVGGMGAVYEAEQENPRRAVALKVIKAGVASPELLRRFKQEAHALGRLHHPGIAQIYEAGTADTGFGPQPYFAMEFIQGKTLGKSVAERSLTARQRLELMSRICEAVHHAHQRGLIHRDLKPENIVVDESGQPKILDFGVARAIDSDAQATRHTDIGQLVGTLAYMSPEQVLADPLELDIRSDVYALGVILYELLAGRLPYEISRAKLHEAIQTISETDPAPLSAVQRIYRGDIETIVAKALEKDKTRRYSSAAELSADLRRYLADEPIMARPTSAAYQVRKFARRHKALVAGAAAVFLVLVVGIAVSAWEAVRANREAATANALNDFLRNDLLAQAGSTTQAGAGGKADPDIKVRTALDRAAAGVAGKFGRQPAVEAAVRDTIGHTYIDLGLYADARKQLERVLTLNRQVLGPENPQTLMTVNALARAEAQGGAFAEAEALIKPALETQKRVLGPQHPDTVSSMNLLGVSYHRQGKLVEAEAMFRQLLSAVRADDPAKPKAESNLSIVYHDAGRYPEAVALINNVYLSLRRTLGPEHPLTLQAMTNLGAFYVDDGKYAQAEAIDAEAIEIHRRVLGPEHPETLISMGNLGLAYMFQGKYPQAEAQEMRTLEIRRRVSGAENPLTLILVQNVALIQTLQGKYASAEPALLRLVETERRVMGPDHPYTLIAETTVASLYQRQHKYEQAERYARDVLERRRRLLGAENQDTMWSAADLALALQSQEKFTASQPLAREALAAETKLRPDGWRRFRAASLLGAVLAGEKKYGEAEPLLLTGYQGMLARQDGMGAPNWHHLDRAHEWIAQLYRDWGKPEKAAEWRGKPESNSAAGSARQ